MGLERDTSSIKPRLFKGENYPTEGIIRSGESHEHSQSICAVIYKMLIKGPPTKD